MKMNYQIGRLIMKKRKKKKINIEDLNEEQSPNMTTQEEFDIKLNKILEEKGIKKNMKITKDQLKEIFDIIYAQEFPLKNVPEIPIDPKTVSEVLGVDVESEEEKKYLDKSLASFKKNRTVLMEPGNHMFAVRYNNGKSYTPSPNTLRFNLEAGKEYKIVSKVEKNKVVFDFVNPKLK